MTRKARRRRRAIFIEAGQMSAGHTTTPAWWRHPYFDGTPKPAGWRNVGPEGTAAVVEEHPGRMMHDISTSIAPISGDSGTSSAEPTIQSWRLVPDGV
jgi:hypothetical protein